MTTQPPSNSNIDEILFKIRTTHEVEHNDNQWTTEFVYTLEEAKQAIQQELLKARIAGINEAHKEYKLFPSSPEELNTELDGVVEKKTREINTKAEEITKLAKEIEEIGKLMSGEKLKDLQAMSYKELTQSQYEAKKLEAGI